MKEKGVVPYVLPKNRGLHKPVQPDERLTSEDEEQEETEEYHEGPQISSDESKYFTILQYSFYIDIIHNTITYRNNLCYSNV